jgi:hypothetical protein
VAFTVVTGNIFQFNPVLMLFGYHFYVAKSADGISYLVISRQKYHKATRQLTCKAIGDYIRLDVSNNG